MTHRASLAVLSLVLAAGCDAPAPRAAAQAGPEGAETPPATAASLDLPTPEAFAAEHGAFESYWYQGRAELSRYRLTQSRYGEARDGEAVLVFVTEPFLPDAQVKHERADGQPDVSVLKLNQSRRFYTGVYPYSLMTSSFLPARGSAAALKVTHTMQEWCGMAFAQLNRRGDAVEVTQRSYFQEEGDRDTRLPLAPFEDALMSMIRRDPSALPTGAVSLVPALHHLRFAHRPLEAYAAEVTRRQETNEAIAPGPLEVLEVRYADLDRVLRVYFRGAFPHLIEGWEEEGRGPVTRAVRTHSYLDAYWSRNGSGDAPYREALGVER